VPSVRPILLAEDVEDDALVIQRVLKRAGIINPIIVVPDGHDAMEYLGGTGMYADREKFPLPGVVLLDLKMPKVGGFEVLEWCKTQPQLKDTLLIILTGQQEVGAMNQAYSLGAHSFLMKPANIEDIKNLTKSFSGYWEEGPGDSVKQ
jgi:CheY-like chemotaxis protein